MRNTQLFQSNDEQKLFLWWLLINGIIFTIGLTSFPAMAIAGAIAGVGQWVILRRALGVGRPTVVLAPIMWFYSIYGGTLLGSIVLPLISYDRNSPFYVFFAALIPGLLIGLYGFLLFRKRLTMASQWIPVHAFAFATATVISPFLLDMNGRTLTFSGLIHALAAALFYSVVTGLALIMLRRGGKKRMVGEV